MRQNVKSKEPKFYPMEPPVRPGDYRSPVGATWERIDQAASDALGVSCIGIPSVRVGLSWTQEYLGLSRHNDHVLVPRFMGQCILNAVNRRGFPVQEGTAEMQLAIVVHQYGLRQDLDTIARECRSRGCRYIEDGAFGIEMEERPGRDSLGKLLALSKVLPVLKGAILVSDDHGLVEFMKEKRRESSVLSWYVLVSLALLRRKKFLSTYSALGGTAYELYLDSKGDNGLLRANLLHGLNRMDSFSAENQRRLAMVEDRFGSMVLIPDTRRLAYAAPLLPGADVEAAQEIFRAHGCNPDLYHIDVARNIFNPDYQRFLIIPLSPRIPAARFEALVESLAGLATYAKPETKETETGAPMASTGQNNN